ncbi:MAG: hypothetical protein IJ906_05665 [Oscillospiraceae bacterium]|nr:hypothetical protein [Oscillospiraceae bacterium]
MENKNNVATMLNAKMPLREMLTLISPAKGKIPTPKYLRDNFKPVAICSLRNFSMTVYENGFAVVRGFKRYAVIRVDKCKDYTFHTVHEKLARQKNSATKPDIAFEAFLDVPWTSRIALTGQDKLDENNDLAAWRAIWEHSEIAEDVQQYNRYIHGESVENTVCNRLAHEEVLNLLTDKQKEALILYYGEGYTMQMIGDMLGITRDAVKDRVHGGLQRIRKYMERNGGMCR